MFGCLNPDDIEETEETVLPKGISAARLPVRAPLAECISEKGSSIAEVESNAASKEE